MKILLTGAHFTTALAVIEELKKFPGVELVYVGRKFSQEGDKTPSVESAKLHKMGVKFIALTTGRLQRSFTLYTIPSLLKIPIGTVQSLWIILTEKPDVVLSFGGYISVPMVCVAWIFSVPVIIHEQTLVSGLANKISSFFADKIAVSFSESNYPPEKTVLTGNPIRREILNIKRRSKKGGLPMILITGGNQGSHALNLAVEGCIEDLTRIAKIIHQTGDSKFKDYERLSKLQSPNYQLFRWVEMADVLPHVDVVVSRAGANTLVELAYLGIPSLVIPIPYLYGDEQNKNAKFFQKMGLATVLPQSNLSSATLLKNILWMLKNITELTVSAKKAKQAVFLGAAKKVAVLTIVLANPNP